VEETKCVHVRFLPQLHTEGDGRLEGSPCLCCCLVHQLTRAVTSRAGRVSKHYSRQDVLRKIRGSAARSWLIMQLAWLAGPANPEAARSSEVCYKFGGGGGICPFKAILKGIWNIFPFFCTLGFDSDLGISRTVESRTIRWAGRVARLGAMTNAYRILGGKYKARDWLRVVGVHEGGCTVKTDL
jgi:hypothetical protein